MDTTTVKVENIIKKAVQIQESMASSRKKSFEKYRKNEPKELNTLRIFSDSALMMICDILSEKVDSTNANVSYQISLSVSFIRTNFILMDLIMQSDLIEAYTLMRNQLEKITRLYELDSKNVLQLNGKTPNVINVLKKYGKYLYPDLCIAAHVSKDIIVELLGVIENGDKIGPSAFPIYIDESITAMKTYISLIIYFTSWKIEFIENNYKKKYPELREHVFNIFDIAIKNGYIIEAK